MPPVRWPAIERHRALLDAVVAREYPDPLEHAFASTADHLGVGGAS